MRIAAGVLLVGAISSTPRYVAAPDPLPGIPRVMFWAWERPEDLTFVASPRSGVAMLAGTITLANSVATCRPRLQPLRITPGTALMVTVRMESRGYRLPPPTEAATCALHWVPMPAAKALQIDFDAKRSERAWYREFLVELRRRLPAEIPLCMTALVSWCESDGWLRDLPVAEAEPMLFRMGRGEVWNRRDFDEPLCRSSVGVATDELPVAIPPGRRIYFFHPARWTEDAYHRAWKEARRLQ